MCPKQVKRALADGAELLFAWGGDGTVQRCVDTLAGADTAARDPAGRDRQPLRDESRDPAGHRAGGRDRAPGRPPKARRRALRRRALRRHGGSGIRRLHDPEGGRVAEGPPRPRRVRLDRVAEPARQAVQGEDQGGRCTVVRRRGQLHPRRQRRAPVRRCRGLRGREPHDGRLEIGVVNADGVVDWMRTLARTAVGQAESSPLVQATTATKIKVKLEPQGALRGRRRRPEEDQVVHDQRRAGRDHRVPTQEGVSRR